MYRINEDNSIYATRGDIVILSVSADDNGKPYTFQAGEVLRIKVFGKKDAESVVLQKDFPITTATQTVELFLDENDTKMGEVISKPKDYWYEVELNPFDNPQTIIGYDEDGPKIFKLFPEGADIPPYVPDPEDIPVIDAELDMASDRPVANQVIARAFANLQAGYQATHEAVAKLHVTPQMFGAIGDGVADDTAAFVKALEYSKVYIPSGTYKLHPTASKLLYLKDNQSIIGSSESVILWGDNYGYDFIPCFIGNNVKNVSISSLKFKFNGVLNLDNTEVTYCGITTRRRNFCAFIGLISSELSVKNCTVEGVDSSHPYDAFIRGLDDLNAVNVSDVKLKHYNNAFSDGFRNSFFTNILGTERSNYVNNSGGTAYYGPSHLFYCSLSNSSLNGIKEVGINLSDGEQGGATLQITNLENAIIENVFCDMANTPVVSLKEPDFNEYCGARFENIIADTTKWDKFDNITLIPIELQFGDNASYKFGSLLINATVIKHNNLVSACQLAGENITANIKIRCDEEIINGNYTTVRLVGLSNSNINVDSATPVNCLIASSCNNKITSNKGLKLIVNATYEVNLKSTNNIVDVYSVSNTDKADYDKTFIREGNNMLKFNGHKRFTTGSLTLTLPNVETIVAVRHGTANAQVQYYTFIPSNLYNTSVFFGAIDISSAGINGMETIYSDNGISVEKTGDTMRTITITSASSICFIDYRSFN